MDEKPNDYIKVMHSEVPKNAGHSEPDIIISAYQITSAAVLTEMDTRP